MWGLRLGSLRAFSQISESYNLCECQVQKKLTNTILKDFGGHFFAWLIHRYVNIRRAVLIMKLTLYDASVNDLGIHVSLIITWIYHPFFFMRSQIWNTLHFSDVNVIKFESGSATKDKSGIFFIPKAQISFNVKIVLIQFHRQQEPLFRCRSFS